MSEQVDKQQRSTKSFATVGLLCGASLFRVKFNKMAGAIIENMSTKKLVFFGFVVLAFQVVSIIVGAFIGK